MALGTDEDGPSGGSPRRLPLASHATVGAASSQPAIPLHLVDAPTQRFYAVALYFALVAWKLYNWGQLAEDNAESFWLFLKWVAIDFVFVFGLPELRIPWLELSQPFVLVAFFCHVVFNWMLMFNIGLPWQAWLFGFVNVFYDSELAISEHNVKLSNILQNSSLIMGRQIVNILPEGTAVLNPERVPFCLGSDQKAVTIPIYFNATVPVQMELIRMDLETNKEEVLKLSRLQLSEIRRQAQRQEKAGEHSVVQFDYSTKKPGAYRLGKVLDEYKLEVQRKTPYTFVVPCPRAEVIHPSPSRCLGDLSDLSFQVDGTPPLKVHYSRTINGKDHSFHFQSLQPEGFTSPLVSSHSLSFIGADEADVTWARSQQVTVSLNESMNMGGNWQYSVNEVHDAFGNVVKYASNEEEQEPRPRPKHLVHNFVVKERPRMHLEGCDLRNPLKVARGESKQLPTVYDLPGRMPDDTSHSVTWLFSPIDTLTKNGDHGDVVTTGSYHARNARDRPDISAPGLYTLRSVTSGSCEGEIQEPSSCLLLNPLEPRLTLQAENIPDKCAGVGAAGHSIGLRVDMDLIGTPPFLVRYEVISNGIRERERIQIPGVRHQMELVPRSAGHHKYIFTHIGDSVYSGQPLHGPEYVLEQDVKPAPSAMIRHSLMKSSACLGEEIEVPIILHGEAPFTLEWEIVHDGKRKHQAATGIDDSFYRIKTAPLAQGGEYTLVLTRVQDNRGCPQSLKEETKISVRRQRPRAAFGLVDGKRRTTVIESAKANLPLRLTGEGPWTISYRNLNESGKVMEKILRQDNDILDVTTRGVYEITDVYDKQCHGSVDPKLSTFEVDWLPRPELSLVPTDSISEQRGRYVKQDVCEGDIDGFDVSLKGSPPYHVEYKVQHKPSQGSSSSAQKTVETMNGKATIQLDTTKAGLYTYTFSSLADSLYNNDRKFKPLSLEQRVNAKPSASFLKPGQTFKFCVSDPENGDKIPISLVGMPPFSLEIEIKHQSGAMPETFRIPTIESNSYGIHIPRQHLKLGTQQVRIRQVKDARGCQSRTDVGGSSVQVQLYDAPAIYPLESRSDYCVGERLSYTLSGTPPFEVWYTFGGAERKAKSSTTNFRRIAETPGEFRITSVSDKASECRATVDLAKTIHPLPSVKISKGMVIEVDIHEGGEVDLQFDFWGTPPFDFTYTRSTNARKGQRSQVLETRHDVSYEHSKVVRTSQEGTYEVVAIKDKFCGFSSQQVLDRKDKTSQGLLGY